MSQDQVDTPFMREALLRDQGDQPTIAMLDLWESLTREKVAVPVEVMAADRREYPPTSNFQGELNTALPMIVSGRVVLALLLEVKEDLVEEIQVTHEIGHWVLNLRGSLKILHQGRNNSLGVGINSMATHPALYELQRSIGHEPLIEIDRRAKSNLEQFSKHAESQSPDQQIANAVMLADDLMNCSEDLRPPLKQIVTGNHPSTARYLDIVLDTASHYDLRAPGQPHRFMRRLVRNVGLKIDDWESVDNLALLRRQVQQVSRKGRVLPPVSPGVRRLGAGRISGRVAGRSIPLFSRENSVTRSAIALIIIFSLSWARSRYRAPCPAGSSGATPPTASTRERPNLWASERLT